MIILPTKSSDSLYANSQNSLRAEIQRVRSKPPTPERNLHVRRLVSAVRKLQMARDNPELFTWGYYTAQVSWLRVVPCMIVVALVTPAMLLQGLVWSVATVLLVVAFVGASLGALFGSWPLHEGLDLRRQLRAALRLAERTKPGRRRSRPEAFDEPFVGPPAADLLVIASLGVGLLLSRSGFRLEGALVAFLSMFVFAVALVRRLKLRLRLPFANERVKPLLIPILAASVGLCAFAIYIGSHILARMSFLGFGLMFYYNASAGLAEEGVMVNRELIQRDERPVSYWWYVCLFLAMAFLLAGVGLLAPDPDWPQTPSHR